MENETPITSTDPEPAGADRGHVGSAVLERTARRRVTRRGVLAGLFGVSATAALGGSAWALDRFVIDHVEVESVSALEASAGVDAAAATTASSTTATFTDTSYTAEGVQVEITTLTSGTGSDTVTAFVADLRLDDPRMLRTAFAQDKFGTNITAMPSEIAAAHDALLAVNGDYYGFRDNGIIVRNGIAHRDNGAREGLVLTADGEMRLYDETSTSADALVSDGAWQTWSFGPGLVEEGKVLSGIDQVEVDTNPGNHSIQGTQPRTLIGMVEKGHYLLVVVDGRSEGYSRGLTMPEAAQLMVDLDAQVAYNIDGGGSSVMFFGDPLEMVSNPLGRGQERATSDILYLA